MSVCRVIVAGGGPAGLAAAGVLARGGVDVTVVEAGSYPRTRLCGEFLSPDAEDALRALGVADLADRLDAPHLSEVRVTAADRGRVRAELRAPLPRPGRGVSRQDLDVQLADAVRATGATIREHTRVAALHDTESAVRVETSAGVLDGEAAIVATGRLARPAGVEDATERGRRWVGVKLHVSGLRLPVVTELHFVHGAYVGLNEVVCGGERRLNVCALARQELFDDAERSITGLLEHIASVNPAFAERWRIAEPIEGSQAAAAGFTFERRGAAAPLGTRPALVCGDAAALIAPLAGDGQAMALTAGVRAAQALLDRRDDAGHLSAAAVADAARWFDQRFRREMSTRLHAGRLLQSALLHPTSAIALVRGVSAIQVAPSWLYRLTRGPITDRSDAYAGRSS
jgi:flavin-dependent dehydrogenase